jgi:hypothetical protein
MRVYCGNNAMDPDLVAGNVVIGTRHGCLKKGIGVGLHLPVDPKYAGPYEPIDQTRKYCGDEDDLPEGYDMFGTVGDCLRTGVGMGKHMAATGVVKRHRPSIMIYLVSFMVLASGLFAVLYFVRPSIVVKTVEKKTVIDWGKFMALYGSVLIVLMVILFVVRRNY